MTHPLFKTKALRLVSNEGRVKRLLQLYKPLIQPYIITLVFFGCNWRRISLLEPRPSMILTARAVKESEKQLQLFNK